MPATPLPRTLPAHMLKGGDRVLLDGAILEVFDTLYWGPATTYVRFWTLQGVNGTVVADDLAFELAD